MDLFHAVMACGAVAFFVVGCSGQSFVVIEDAPHGFAANQTLGLRTATDLGALAPTTKMAWLEVCDKEVTESKKVVVKDSRDSTPAYTEVKYVHCAPADHLQQIADKSTSTGYIAGVAAPVIQGAAIAYAGHEIGRGIAHSGSRTTNNASNGNTNSNSATNGNSNNATGGNGQGGNGGNGGNGQGGNGGNGGNGGTPPGCAHNNPNGC
jgi:uncharacterized membrane protein YgcG